MCWKKCLSFYFIQASNEGIQGNFSGDLLQSGGMLIVAKGKKKKKKKSERNNNVKISPFIHLITY